MCCSHGSVWHFDDAGGNWVELYHVGAGRAVMLGNDHGYSDTYCRSAAEYFGEDETGLPAGAPDWWRPVVVQAMAAEEYVGFVYGFDGARWQRAEYDAEDCFTSVGLPALSADRTHESVVVFAGSAPGLDGAAARRAAGTLRRVRQPPGSSCLSDSVQRRRGWRVLGAGVAPLSVPVLGVAHVHHQSVALGTRRGVGYLGCGGVVVGVLGGGHRGRRVRIRYPQTLRR